MQCCRRSDVDANLPETVRGCITHRRVFAAIALVGKLNGQQSSTSLAGMASHSQ
ncbi:hypothetical protein ACLOJK_024461 [Asimina triloba]